jgi:putative colanic acid biosynthesis UDP-glucose lipid carrier transferase
MGWFISTTRAADVARRDVPHAGNVREQGINAKRVVIFGYGPLGREMYLRVQRIRTAGYRVVGVYDEHCQGIPYGVTTLRTMAEKSTRSCAPGRARNLADAADGRVSRSVRCGAPVPQCDRYPLGADVSSVELLGHRFSDFMGLPVIDLNAPPVSGITACKASFDRVFAAAC